MNPQNKCAHLFDQDLNYDITIDQMLDLQKNLQKFLAKKGKAIDHDSATFKEKVDDISRQWRNMNLEMAELLERLPFKEWKTYGEDELNGNLSDETRLEIMFEAIDVLHFLFNIFLCLDIDGKTLRKLYVTKNKENLDRQNRGY